MKRVQLFILPFAGGNSKSFRRMMPFLDDFIEPITIEYSGRLKRSKEKFISDYMPFMEDVLIQIKKHRNDNLPYAVFGYSLGSVLLYDLLANGMIDGIPIHAFICAKGSPFFEPTCCDFANISDEEFIKFLYSLGGINDIFLTDPRFFVAYMQPVRNDFSVWEQYRYKGGVIPCSATIIYSDQDANDENIHDWGKVVKGNVFFYKIGEKHFFIYNYWREVASIINCRLKYNLML